MRKLFKQYFFSAVFCLLAFFLPFAASHALTIESVEVIPEAEEDFVVSNLPFDIGDAWTSESRELARKFIAATDRYESFHLEWNPDNGQFRVQVTPYLYFEDVEWRGDSFPRSRSISRACVSRRESINLSQQRLSELTNCLNNQIRSRGYLDAQVIVFSEGEHLVIELRLGELYRVRKMEFQGAEHFRSGFLQMIVSNSEGSPYRAFALQEDTEKIRRQYISRNFFLVEISQPVIDIDARSKKVDIRWTINEGPRWRIDFTGDFTSRRFLEEVSQGVDSLSEWVIDEIMRDVRDELRNEGYLDVEVTESRSRIGRNYYRINIHTRKGRQYWLTDPVWVGLDNPELIEQIYLREGRLRPGRRFGEQAFRDLFEESFFPALVSEGFLNVRVRSLQFNIDRSRYLVEPVIAMNEGQRVIIQEVSKSGILPIFENIVEMRRLNARLEVGSPLDPISLEERQADLLVGLRRRGFLDAEIDLTWEAMLSGHRVNLLVKPGPRYRIADFIVRGLDRTKIRVVRREVLFRKGQYYSQQDIEDTISQILRLGIARSLDIQVLEKDPERGIVYLVLDLREAARFRFETGPGYGTNEGVRAVFRGTYANIAGTGRRLSLFAKGSRELRSASLPDNVLNEDAQKVPFIERRVSLEYFEPYLFNFPVDGRIGVTHEKEARRQFAVENNSIQFSLDWRINRNWTYSPSYKVEFSDPFNVLITETAPVDSSRATRLHSFNQRVQASYVDDIFSPQRGFSAFAFLELFDGFLGGNLNFWKLSLNQTFYYPIHRVTRRRSIGFALSVNQGFSKAYSTTAEVPVEKRFRVGGERSVRGFAQDAITPVAENGEILTNGGLSTFFFRTEINFPMVRNFDFLAFFDGGNIYRLNSKFNPFDLRYGAGMGVRFNTPVGPVKFGYAFALDRQEGEDIGQIYFGVGPL